MGDKNKLHFMLPGHDVVIDQWYNDGGKKKDTVHGFDPHSGSSVATALAAGLAALIVECVRLGVIHTKENPSRQNDSSIFITDKDLKQIHKHDAMTIAMKSVGMDVNLIKAHFRVFSGFSRSFHTSGLGCGC